MRIEEGSLLRIYVGESDRHEGEPRYEAIVERAREAGLAGATVLRGKMGYGGSSVIHTSKVLRLSEDLPLVIEIVDAAEKIEAFLDDLADLAGDAFVTVEKVRVIEYD
jgi:PII-like signaling protein